MSYEVEIFRGEDLLPDGVLPLEPLLREFFERHLGQALDGAHIALLFLPEAEAGRTALPQVELTGGFNVSNLRPRYGRVQVRVTLDDQLLYQHPHPVSELLGRALRDTLARRAPGERHWGVGLRGPDLDRRSPLERPVPVPELSAPIEVGVSRSRVFDVEEMPPAAAPLRALADLGVDVPRTDVQRAEPVTVVVRGPVHDELAERRQFSTEIEEGGFLTGRLYRDELAPDAHIVELTAIIPAERTGASLLSFTFTGESFLRVGARLAVQQGGDELVGWYHTHLFAAGAGFGLSSVDVQLHRSVFQRPWQVAALLNIAKGHRVLRFYRLAGGGMTLVPYWRAG